MKLYEYDNVDKSNEIVDFLKNINELLVSNYNDKNKIDCVGYLYSKDLEKVFILPKIYKNTNIKEKEFSELLSNICAVLRHFKKRNPNGKSDAENFDIESKVFSPSNNTDEAILPDIERALIDFHKKNKYLFTQIALSKINKTNKIKWTKTVTNKQPLIQNKKVVYPELYTQKKEINYDEKLIVLFYSVLNYLKITDYYNIEKPALNYKLFSVDKIELFRSTNKGIYYLKSIRSRYFSDKLVGLWKLLYAYFEKVYKLKSSKHNNKDYLLVSNFEMVFEDMVEQLIGNSNIEYDNLIKTNKFIKYDDKNKYKLYIKDDIRDILKTTEKWRNPDHIYFVNNNENENIYCIADSKYRKTDNFNYSYYDLKKQFDYAKLLNENKREDEIKIYNFFIYPDMENVDKTKNLPKDWVECVDNTFMKYKYDDDATEYTLITFKINFLSLLKSYIKKNIYDKSSIRKKIINNYKKQLENNLGNYKKPEYIIGIGNTIFDIFTYLQNTPYCSLNKTTNKLLGKLSFYDKKDAISVEIFDEMKNSNQFLEVTEILQQILILNISDVFEYVKTGMQKKYSETQIQ